MHQGYYTPIKTISSHQRNLFNSDSTHRQGDWVCINCQNLNYSFRKKCNRCKTQTRQQNEAHSVYSYYYFPQFDSAEIQPFNVDNLDKKHDLHSPEKDEGKVIDFRESRNTEENKQNICTQWSGCMETPKKKKPLMSTENSKLDGLPSVSPLVKKYKLKQHHTTLEKNENADLKNMESPLASNDFENIKIRDFDKLIQDLNGKPELETSPFKDVFDDEDGVNFMKDIEESISRIII